MASAPKAIRLTVLASEAVEFEDGSVGLQIHSKQMEPVTFEITLKSIEILRRQLAKAEDYLRKR